MLSPASALLRMLPCLALLLALGASALRAEEAPATLTIDCGIGPKMVMVRMTFARIPAGECMIGSPEGKGEKDEQPARGVQFDRDFYMGVCEVTQAQYETVMGKNPSTVVGQDYPVQKVSWNDAVEFCKKLSARCGERIRLPTEAEWEYACRAGSLAAYCFGSDESKLSEYAWTMADKTAAPDDKAKAAGKDAPDAKEDENTNVHPVGMKKPNAWGLYDMHGNVWEWCQSLYKPYPYRADDGRENLDAPGARVLRGGGWFLAPGAGRSAYRSWAEPTARQMYHGFRVVLIPWPTPAR